MSTPKFQGYIAVIDNDPPRVFKHEKAAVTFVSHEHLRRWDSQLDAWREGQEFDTACLYYFSLKGSRLLDSYSTADGDAEGWRDAERNERATKIASHNCPMCKC